MLKIGRPAGAEYRKGLKMADKNPADVNDGWTTVADETPALVVFDTPGEDVFTGTFVEKRHIINPNDADQQWDQYVFRGTDGDLYGINSSYSIAKGMEAVNPGQECRITFVKTVDVGRPSPMKDFKIETRG
jgi:hypothetical protein